MRTRGERRGREISNPTSGGKDQMKYGGIEGSVPRRSGTRKTGKRGQNCRNLMAPKFKPLSLVLGTKEKATKTEKGEKSPLADATYRIMTQLKKGKNLEKIGGDAENRKETAVSVVLLNREKEPTRI